LTVATKALLEIGEYLQASILRAAKVPFEGMRFAGGRVLFQFDDEDGRASETLREHLNGKLRLPTSEVANSVGTVKNEMFSFRRMEGAE